MYHAGPLVLRGGNLEIKIVQGEIKYLEDCLDP